MAFTLSTSVEKIFFQAPNPPQYSLTSHTNHLFWLPASEQSIGSTHIPSMFYSLIQGANYLMIWCHGNGCDIGGIGMGLVPLSQSIPMHILALEYPSYGLCIGPQEPSEETINNHVERAYSFVRDTLKWPTNRILLYGHSIGTGPACHI